MEVNELKVGRVVYLNGHSFPMIVQSWEQESDKETVVTVIVVQDSPYQSSVDDFDIRMLSTVKAISDGISFYRSPRSEPPSLKERLKEIIPIAHTVISVFRSMGYPIEPTTIEFIEKFREQLNQIDSPNPCDSDLDSSCGD
jgi:hypothetical protein